MVFSPVGSANDLGSVATTSAECFSGMIQTVVLDAELDDTNAEHREPQTHTDQFDGHELFGGPEVELSGYSPSVASNFDEMLPGTSWGDDMHFTDRYSPETVVQSAWKSLRPETPKMPWEESFWDRFLDPNISAMDMLEKSYKGLFQFK